MTKPSVLIFVDYYLPGYKAGGPIASVSRMVKNLRDEFDIRIFTRDRDLGDSESYAGIEPNTWTDVDGVKVYYAGPENLAIRSLKALVGSTQPKLIYLNSYFSVLSRRVLLLAKRRQVSGAKVAIAPRGEFSKGALAIKAAKKRAYLTMATWSRLTRNVVWHVSSIHEREDVLRAAGSDCLTIIEAPDLLAIGDGLPAGSSAQKEVGLARFAWLSRISPKKNLIGAIRMLENVQGEAHFAIYGPVEDQAYWQECQAAIRKLPSNVKVEYMGGLTPTEVVPALAQHHFFLFPTFGENFGHVIPEALCGGCPVLLSDQTPWLDLEENSAGWVMSLASQTAWEKCIQGCIDMDNESYEIHSKSARTYIENFSRRQHPNGNSHLFQVALAS
jgi:glycosyltransferase involved in cell wall biosynthesis